MCGPGFVAGIGKVFTTVKAAVGSLGAVGTGLQVAGGAASALGALQQARVAKKTAALNAKMQTEAANEAIRLGEERSDRQRRAGAAARADMKAAMAANGIDVTSAGALDLLDESKTFNEADAMAIREDYRIQAQNNLAGAQNSLIQGSSQAASARTGAFRTILGTASRVGKKYSKQVVGAYG